MDFITVTILHNLDAYAVSSLLGVVLVPGLCILLAGNPNLGLVRRAHADVAAAVVYRDARIPGNLLRRDVQVKVKAVSPLPNVAREIFPSVVNANHDAEENEKSQHKKSCSAPAAPVSPHPTRRRAIGYRQGRRGYRGRVLDPIRNSSTARAHCRPSRIAQTTSDWPRRMSPAAN